MVRHDFSVRSEYKRIWCEHLIRFEGNKKVFIRLFYIEANQWILHSKWIQMEANNKYLNEKSILSISLQSEYFEAKRSKICSKRTEY